MGIKDYVIQATYPGGSNIDAANEVAAILNQAYQSPLYKNNEMFRGKIVYEKNNNYVTRD